MPTPEEIERGDDTVTSIRVVCVTTGYVLNLGQEECDDAYRRLMEKCAKKWPAGYANLDVADVWKFVLAEMSAWIETVRAGR